LVRRQERAESLPGLTRFCDVKLRVPATNEGEQRFSKHRAGRTATNEGHWFLSRPSGDSDIAQQRAHATMRRLARPCPMLIDYDGHDSLHQSADFWPSILILMKEIPSLLLFYLILYEFYF
jgi:hypothetical protein